jgi:hypothetical protein
MDVRLVVGGLLTRNAVLSRLLWNYADRLEEGFSRHCSLSAPCFIVPNWRVDQPPSAPFGSRLLTVQAHTSRTDPRRHETLDAILRLVHVVLTDDHAGSSVRALRVRTPVDLVAGELDTVVRLGIWNVAPVPRRLEAGSRRLLPWPDCSTSVVVPGAPTPGTFSIN